MRCDYCGAPLQSSRCRFCRTLPVRSDRLSEASYWQDLMYHLGSMSKVDLTTKKEI